MKFTLIYPGDIDQSIIESLAELNYAVSAPPLSKLWANNLHYSTKFIPSRLQALTAAKCQISQYLKVIKEKRVSFIYPSYSINGIQYLVMGHLNQTCGLPGLDKKLSRFWMRKSRYLRYFNQLGIKTARVFQKVSTQEEPDLRLITAFPVICKPDCGSESQGVFLASSPEELQKLFQPDFEGVGGFMEHCLELKNGKKANYLYDNCGSKYLIEEFISGPVFCVTGIKAVNGIEISLIYQVTPSAPPFRSENEFLAPLPSNEELSLKKIHSLTSCLVGDSVFPYGPFVFDCVLASDKELYLLDASPRLNLLPIDFFKLCYGDASYKKRAVRAFLNQDIEIQERREPLTCIYLKNLPLPKGSLIQFAQEESFSDDVVDWSFSLRPGDQIYRERNDFLSKYRGHLAVKGVSANQAKARWLTEFKKLNFSIREDTEPIY